METLTKNGAAKAPAQKNQAYDLEVHEIHKEGTKALIGAGSFSFYATFNGCGDVKLNIKRGGITPNSRVFVSAAEYNADPAYSRFLGGAKVTVCNVAPYTDGIAIWVNVGWVYSLNVRLDILVDP